MSSFRTSSVTRLDPPDVPLALRPGLVSCLSPWRPVDITLVANEPQKVLPYSPQRIAWYLAVPLTVANMLCRVAPEATVKDFGIPVSIANGFGVTSDSWYSLVMAEWWMVTSANLTARIYELVRPS